MQRKQATKAEDTTFELYQRRGEEKIEREEKEKIKLNRNIEKWETQWKVPSKASD